MDSPSTVTPPDPVRVLLCEARSTGDRSLVMDIVRRAILPPGAGRAFKLVWPQEASREAPVVPFERLEAAAREVRPDLVLLLGDAVSLARAKGLLEGRAEVVGLTRAGYAMVNLEPENVAGVLAAVASARRGRISGPVPQVAP